jgi:hypothetical protein
MRPKINVKKTAKKIKESSPIKVFSKFPSSKQSVIYLSDDIYVDYNYAKENPDGYIIHNNRMVMMNKLIKIWDKYINALNKIIDKG